MKTPLIIAAGVAAAGALAWYLTRSGAAPAPGAAGPATDAATAQLGQVALPGVPPANTGIVPPSGGMPGGVLGTVAGGIKVNNAVGDLVEKVGGQGAGDLARINITTAPALLAKVGVQTGLAKVGVPPEAARQIGLTTGLAVAGGVPAVLAKGTGEVISKGISLVLGKKAEQSVRSAVSQLDPTKPGSIVNKAVVKPVSTIVKGLGKLF
jgi:hypothetical protein